jgi:hypothetical protein
MFGPSPFPSPSTHLFFQYRIHHRFNPLPYAYSRASHQESPILWYNELRRQLVKLGLKLVEGFPCLYTNRWLILFVYVDNIVMAFHQSNAHHHKFFEKNLADRYNIKAMRDLTWFLGIRIVREQALHKTWLVQDAFIDKVCARFGIEAVGRSPDVPLTEN